MQRHIPSAPKSVFLNVTSQCNLRCIYCSADTKLCPNLQDLDTNEILRLIETLAGAKVFRVIVTGGEPLVREDIFDILNKIDQYHGIGLNTNATLVTNEVAARLRTLHHLRGVAVSLDGADQATHGATRGADSFQKTIEGIKILRQCGIPVSLETVLTKRNFRRMEEIVQLARDLGVGGIAFAHLARCGRATKSYDNLILNLQDNMFVRKCLDNLKDKYPNFISGTHLRIPMAKDRVSSNSMKPKRLFACGAGKDACAITSDGWVIPCNKMSDFKCGNVRDQRFLDIWQNSNMMNKIRKLKDLHTDAVKECAQCEFRGICGGGCRADAYLVHGSLTAPDPLCWYAQGPDRESKAEPL